MARVYSVFYNYGYQTEEHLFDTRDLQRARKVAIEATEAYEQGEINVCYFVEDEFVSVDTYEINSEYA